MRKACRNESRWAQMSWTMAWREPLEAPQRRQTSSAHAGAGFTAKSKTQRSSPARSRSPFTGPGIPIFVAIDFIALGGTHREDVPASECLFFVGRVVRRLRHTVHCPAARDFAGRSTCPPSYFRVKARQVWKFSAVMMGSNKKAASRAYRGAAAVTACVKLSCCPPEERDGSPVWCAGVIPCLRWQRGQRAGRGVGPRPRVGPGKAGFEVRYIEFGMAKPPGVLCQRCEFVRKS